MIMKLKGKIMGKIIVAKFGGTSLADAGQFKKVKKIVKSDKSRRFIVASAPGKRFSDDIKVTDMLLKCHEAAKNSGDFKAELLKIKDRFKEIITNLCIDFPLEEEIEIIKCQIEKEADFDYICSRGEYLCSRILAMYLDYTFVDPAWCVCFSENGILDEAMTERALRAALNPLENAVVAGFYGADSNEKIHVFPRGGSDITGSLVALAARADLYENWTDVSGLLSADPGIVDEPHTVDYLSFRELRTLSYMGASVLHTDAVLPASEAGIAINIRNTNRPDDDGTIIVKHPPKGEERKPVTGVAGRVGMSVIQVEKVMVSDGAGFSAILLDILKNRKIPFEQCLTGIDTVTLVIRSDVIKDCKDELIEEIKAVLSPDFVGLKEDLSMIAVVGEKGTESSDANVRILQSLADAGIEISTINQGAGKLNLLIGVPTDRYKDAIRQIYGTIKCTDGITFY